MIIATFSKTITVGMVVYSEELARVLTVKTWQIMVGEFFFIEFLAIVFKRVEELKEDI